ncbi:VOC family protein [Algoriphagus sp. D3-2-R+10]|uniref:VOC family protein n=1 Tax=Algoriphagus aurantiacus TaxID=3103948 RepID=UPI002B3BE36D|nr:VOC family protein [Algoriphagus sp. D3-2-R+10]MEB2774329.1 VOC family protein [Algoriphagus sp. D3-2-R+10]
MKSTMTGNRYVLAVKNLRASSDYYKGELGFKTLWDEGGWHFLVRDNIKIMLGECPDEKSANEIGNHSYFGYFEVEYIDDLYSEYKTRKVEFLGDIENKPWRQREFAIRTIDGHRITFGEAISDKEFKR